MTLLILGLLLFLGVHSVRIFADDWRSRMVARMGLGPWKGAYSVLALLGLALLVWGYAQARNDTIWLWLPPVGLRHLAALLTLPAFVLLAAAYVPGNRIRARLRHPMLLGVKLWALAHLICNGSLADVLLFGAFLVWAVLCYRAARRRERLSATGGTLAVPAGSLGATLATVGVGVLAWAVFAFWLHGWLIGVAPLGGS